MLDSSVMNDASPKRRTCFVVGPIGAENSPERRLADWLLNGIVRPALGGEPFNYDVKRADEFTNPGMITTQAIIELFEADLVLADLTGGNENAYYELAVRHMEETVVETATFTGAAKVACMRL